MSRPERIAVVDRLYNIGSYSFVLEFVTFLQYFVVRGICISSDIFMAFVNNFLNFFRFLIRDHNSGRQRMTDEYRGSKRAESFIILEKRIDLQLVYGTLLCRYRTIRTSVLCGASSHSVLHFFPLPTSKITWLILTGRPDSNLAHTTVDSSAFPENFCSLQCYNASESGTLASWALGKFLRRSVLNLIIQ